MHHQIRFFCVLIPTYNSTRRPDDGSGSQSEKKDRQVVGLIRFVDSSHPPTFLRGRDLRDTGDSWGLHRGDHPWGVNISDILILG